MKALPVSDRCHLSSSSKNWFRPSVKSDMCVCMPEPFSPKIGFGMKVAWKPAFFAISLTMRRYVIVWSAISSAGAKRMSISCWDGPTSWWTYSIGIPIDSSARTVSCRSSLAASIDVIADHPGDLGLSLAPGHQLERARVGDRDHVRLLDRVEAGDRRAVEAHPVVERLLHLRRRDREALQVPLEIGEPEQEELHALILDPLQDLLAVVRARRRSRLALDLRHFASLNAKAPGDCPRLRCLRARRRLLPLPRPCKEAVGVLDGSGGGLQRLAQDDAACMARRLGVAHAGEEVEERGQQARPDAGDQQHRLHAQPACQRPSDGEGERCEAERQ